MDIPLLSEEEIEKELAIDENIRNQIIEFLNGKGYKHLPAEQASEDEVTDFFVKDNQLVQIIISYGIPEEVLKQIAEP